MKCAVTVDVSRFQDHLDRRASDAINCFAPLLYPMWRHTHRIARSEGIEVAHQQMGLASERAEKIENDRDLLHRLIPIVSGAQVSGNEAQGRPSAASALFPSLPGLVPDEFDLQERLSHHRKAVVFLPPDRVPSGRSG